jgi:hypothetical protein
MKNKGTIVLFIICIALSGTIGYSQGFKDGVNYAMNKAINAAEVLFDIQLTGKAKQLAIGFPDILDRVPYEVRQKLGINATYQEINETIKKLVEMKYGK